MNTSRSFPHSWLITRFVSRLTRPVSLVEQEMLTFPEHLSSLPVFSGVRVTRSLVLCVCFVDRPLSFCTFSLGHYIVCSSSIYGLWLPSDIFKIFLILLLSKSNSRISLCQTEHTDCIDIHANYFGYQSLSHIPYNLLTSWNIYIITDKTRLHIQFFFTNITERRLSPA